ncbi:chromosome partitioning protein ParA, partial [Pseudomonas aeruginosa]
LEHLLGKETEVTESITNLDQQIKLTLNAKGTPTDLFSKVFELKEITDKAREENKFFEQKASLDESESASKARLDAIYDQIFLDIETAINTKLEEFNKVVYGPERNPSQLRI